VLRSLEIKIDHAFFDICDTRHPHWSRSDRVRRNRIDGTPLEVLLVDAVVGAALPFRHRRFTAPSQSRHIPAVE
jgi:hypothetical protein